MTVSVKYKDYPQVTADKLFTIEIYFDCPANELSFPFSYNFGKDFRDQTNTKYKSWTDGIVTAQDPPSLCGTYTWEV